MSYANWQKRLEIAKLPTVAARRAELSRLKLANMEPTIEDEGYYRIPITQKDATGNGRNIVTGYIPVAIWFDGDAMVGVSGTEQEEMSLTKIVDQWTWFCAHPISYELYKEVAEDGGLWPDIPVGPTTLLMIEPAVPAANREVAKTDNAPPPEEVVPLDVQHATAIDNAIAAALTKVTSEAEDAQASGSKNRIAELRLAADKAGKAIYEPLHRQYVAEQKKWSAPVKRAEAKEKELNTAILSFRESERKKAVAAAAEAARLQQIQDEANERAAQRAIARGEPEDAPPVVEAAPAQENPEGTKALIDPGAGAATNLWHAAG